jgi:integrase
LKEGWAYLDAASTRERHDDILPLAPDLLNMLRLRGKQSGPVFMSSSQRWTFLNDVRRAGLEYNHERGQADRKSLRKTFGTHLAMAGVDFRVTVRLMRHNDPRLTQAVYTDPMLLGMHDAVGSLVRQRKPEKAPAAG